MLGPSILFASPPFCTGYAFHACRRTQAGLVGYLGLAIALVELLVLVTLMIYGTLVL